MSTSQSALRIICSSCSTTIDGVAEVAQPLERADQPVVVALVEPDRRLVEDVEDADELRADLGREPQPLRLPARERGRRAVEGQVAHADVVEEREPLADLLHDPRADQLLGLAQLEAVEEPERRRNRETSELVDVPLPDRDREHLGLEPRALADRAGPERHVLLDPLALRRAVGVAVAALERGDDPLEGERVGPPAAHPVAIRDVDALAARAVQEPSLLLLGQLPPGPVGRDLVAVGDRLDHRLVEARVPDRPRDESALVDREARVRDEEVGVDLLLRTEARAARAGPVRRVEREDPRLELRKRDPVIGAGEPLRVHEALTAVDQVDPDEPLGEGDRRLHRLRQPEAEVVLHDEPVDDDLDRVLELLVEHGRLVEQVLLAVDLDTREALVAKALEHVAVLALPVADDRGVDREARSLGEREDLLDDRVHRLPGDRPAADRAVRPPDARVEESEVVVDLRDRADGRARVPRRRLLVDRDRRARARRSSRRRASPSSAGTGARTPTATRRTGAGPRRRSCRRRGSTSPSRRAP